MNSSHLVTPMNTHHHHNTHHPLTTTTNSYTTKMPTSNSNNNNNQNTNTIHNYHYTNEQQQQNATLFGSNSINNKSIFSTTTTANTQSSTPTNTNVNNVGAGLSSASTASSTLPTTTSTSYKFAPARRLAARQTLRLAIPKQPGDSAQYSHLNSTAPASMGNSNATQFKHCSPSQLPPAPILKRTPIHTPNFSSSSSINSHIPKSASPLESHNLPNVLHHSSTPICTATPSSGGSSKFLRVRNPSITLSSSDACNNTDLFAFAKEFSSPAVGGGDHSPIFAEIASSISPSTASSGSPTNHLSRLFNLSPSTLRSYGNVSTVQIFNKIKLI